MNDDLPDYELLCKNVLDVKRRLAKAERDLNVVIAVVVLLVCIAIYQGF